MCMVDEHSSSTGLGSRFSTGRREFLATATRHAAILAALSPVSAFVQAAGQPMDFAQYRHIRRAEAERLLVTAKTLFPHDFIPDSDYANALSFLDRSLASNASAVDSLRQVLDQLPQDFEKLENEQREAALSVHSDSGFFKQFRRLTIQAIYKKPENWQHFGYPGPSLSFGGWVNRELVDIDWLPVTT